MEIIKYRGYLRAEGFWLDSVRNVRVAVDAHGHIAESAIFDGFVFPFFNQVLVVHLDRGSRDPLKNAQRIAVETMPCEAVGTGE